MWLWAFLVISCVRAGTLPPSELAALYDLYDSTNGAGWSGVGSNGVVQGWRRANAGDPCSGSWTGVVCFGTAQDHVRCARVLQPAH